MPVVKADVKPWREPERLNGKYAFEVERSHGQMEEDGETLRNLILEVSCVDGAPLSDGSSAMGREITLFVPFYEKPEWKESYKRSQKELRSKLFTFCDVDSDGFDTEADFVGKSFWAVCRSGKDLNGVVVDQIRDLIGPYE